MEELKQEATELGLDFKGNISKTELKAMIDEKKQIANDSPVVKPIVADANKKVKVKITPRDSEEKEGFARLNKYTIQYQFDEEISIPQIMVDFIKSKGGYVTSSKGEKKWQSRYIVELV